jgi:hypothetical protein
MPTGTRWASVTTTASTSGRAHEACGVRDPRPGTESGWMGIHGGADRVVGKRGRIVRPGGDGPVGQHADTPAGVIDDD